MNRKLKAGIVGLGRMGRGQGGELASYPELFELVACADSDPDRLESLPDAFDYAVKYPSLEAMLADSNVELVSIVTRHKEHVPMAKMVLEAGKYAVVEKPVATGVGELLELKKCAEQHPGRLFFRHNRRFEAVFRKALELANSGILGEVNYVKLCRNVGYCRRNDWMTMSEFYGGLLTNWGPHVIDQALRFLNGKVVDVWADVRRVISIGDGDDLFKILLKADNGRLADIEASGVNTLPGRELEIIGSRGTLVYPDNGKILLRTVDPSFEFKPLSPHPENPPFAYGNFEEDPVFVESRFDVPSVAIHIIWRHIHDAIVNGIPFEVKFDDALEVVRVTEAAFRKANFAPMLRYLSSW